MGAQPLAYEPGLNATHGARPLTHDRALSGAPPDSKPALNLDGEPAPAQSPAKKPRREPGLFQTSPTAQAVGTGA